MPVAMAKMFGSKMMSSGGKPMPTSSSYALAQISVLRAKVSAWPFSSKAITITAAPYWRPRRAWRRNSASPSFMEMELTTPLPWMHLRPASMTLHLDESSMMGTREMSGSEAISLRNYSIAAMESSIAPSMLMSMTWAPFSTLGSVRGGTPRSAPAIALMWAGEVPQQPPTMFTTPLRAHSTISPASG